MNSNINAICVLNPDYLKSNSKVNGVIYLDQVDDTVRIYGTIYGLKPNENSNNILQNISTFNKTPSIYGLKAHAIHIHEYGDLSVGCSKCCLHYNPFKLNHGGPMSANRHVGDLGNIIGNENGIATFSIIDNLVKLSGEHSVIGRSIVIHEDEDDLGMGMHSDSLTTGHAGKRLVCGVIGYRENK